ncbi:MAG: hypothetical protein JWO59_2606 [Chloroflexi bacterium]|nr:hypothetical protein [Chloroflexota bacterium]
MSTFSWRSVADRFRSATRASSMFASEARGDEGPLLDEDMLRQLTRLQLESGRSFTDWLAGEHEGRRQTQSVEFEDYRGYSPGDDFRLIDWNAYARLGELFVKTSLAEETMTISLLVDCSRSMDFGTPSKLRYAKQLATALGGLALLHGDRVRVFGLGDGDAFPGAPLYGPGEMGTMIAELERLPILPSTDLHGSIAAFQQIAEPHGVVILLSDLLAPMNQIETLDFLELQGRFVVVVHVIDPVEAAPVLQGTIELRDRETGATSLVSITPAVRQQYGVRFQERAAEIESRLAKGSVRYIKASTAIPPIDFIASGMRQEGVVAQA